MICEPFRTVTMFGTGAMAYHPRICAAVAVLHDTGHRLGDRLTDGDRLGLSADELMALLDWTRHAVFAAHSGPGGGDHQW
jgi:hypothetical protein